ncbi:hypothetical protein PROP_01952 [Propionicimonas sp. T2.31MG-18]|uniref:SemiSWEET family sugar transporter n=1 Tax=Propionicimonas sp. T2.31MG-18 TaxID=3157620 RepID=UPI0035E96124
MTPVDIVGWSATVLGTILGVPQLVRLLRTRSVAGLSLIAWQATLSINIGWTVHGLLIGQPPQVVTNVLALLTTVPILVLMARGLDRPVAATLLPGAVLGVAMIAIDLLLGSAAYGVVVTVPSVVIAGGQTVELARARDVRGLSPVFLVLGLVNITLWETWGLMVGDSGTMIAVSIAMAIGVVNFVWFVLRRLGLRALFPRDEDEDAVPLLPAVGE